MIKSAIKRKIIKILISSGVLGVIALFLVILIAILVALDFFNTLNSDGYVENNMEYAERYRETANKFFKSNKGYVSLERIVYFYNEDENLSFDQLYNDNLDQETKKMKPISEVCSMKQYKSMEVCKEENYKESGQIDEETSKPFNPPVKFADTTITSYFMEERIVFGKSDMHSGWDLAASNNTPVYAVCDGKIKAVSFTQSSNETNTSAGLGNYISLECNVDDVIYTVKYGHLYPGSSKVLVNQSVSSGTVLAGIGTTGYSTGPHLHYQVVQDGKNIDGMSLVNFDIEDNSIKIESNLPNNLHEFVPNYN